MAALPTLHKYHPWANGDCDARLGLQVLSGISIPQTTSRSVKRANHYQEASYGAPLRSLEADYTIDQWKSTTSAVWDNDRHLILRIKSTMKLPYPYPSSIHEDHYSAVAFCPCANQQLRSMIYQNRDGVVERLYYKSSLGYSDDSHADILCLGCCAVYEVRRRCLWSSPVSKYLQFL